jgi:hypothetical protein
MRSTLALLFSRTFKDSVKDSVKTPVTSLRPSVLFKTSFLPACVTEEGSTWCCKTPRNCKLTMKSSKRKWALYVDEIVTKDGKRVTLPETIYVPK